MFSSSGRCAFEQSFDRNRFFEAEAELGGDVGELDEYTSEEVRSELGLLLNSSSAGFEWMSHESAMHGSTSETISAVNRGLFDTRPLDHHVGARIWAVSEGLSVTSCQCVVVTLLV